MPYIKQEDRQQLHVDVTAQPNNVGELTYCFFRSINDYLEMRPINYQTMAEILGALESAKLELQERLIGYYESKKCDENGDVFSPELKRKLREARAVLDNKCIP